MFRGRVHVSIPVFPECDPSIIYGVFDTLWAAGRVWDNMKGGSPDGGLFEPRLVCAEPGPIQLITGVSILPQDTIEQVTKTDVVFVPNVMVEHVAEACAMLDRRLIDWIKRMHAAGRAALRRLRRRAGAGGGRPARGAGGDDALGL